MAIKVIEGDVKTKINDLFNSLKTKETDAQGDLAAGLAKIIAEHVNKELAKITTAYNSHTHMVSSPGSPTATPASPMT